MESQTNIQKNSLVLVAAGRGSRAGGMVPKQYQPLAGKPLIRHTLENILKTGLIDDIVCVIHRDDQDLFEAATKGLNLTAPAYGGATRQESVKNGLKLLDKNTKYAFIHDAARPFVTSRLIHCLLEKLDSGADGVIPAVRIVDTLKYAEKGQIRHTVDREGLYAVQTPQAFPYRTLLDAHTSVERTDHTDDASVMEAAGYTMTLSDGDAGNYKVTVPEDFLKAERDVMMALPDIRTGLGYDVHRFEEGNQVILCGVSVPHTHALKGHSDADVALHALTDALLASIAAGDIGSHFPPSDARWQGAPSSIFLQHAADLVKKAGGMISNVAVTIICESPKIGPYGDQMQSNLSELLNISASRVSVQATTTEKLGFTGRREGIAAEAVATVRLP